MTYQKCPICLGGGTVGRGMYMSQYAREVGYTSNGAGDVKCRTCDGQGIIPI